jgi:hypothetical protein
LLELVPGSALVVKTALESVLLILAWKRGRLRALHVLLRFVDGMVEANDNKNNNGIIITSPSKGVWTEA